MSARSLLPTSSSFVRASSKSTCVRTTCPYQQTRPNHYLTYRERRQEAKEWLTTEGARYRRAPGKGKTNYLNQAAAGKSDGKKGDSDINPVGQEGTFARNEESASDDAFDAEKAAEKNALMQLAQQSASKPAEEDDKRDKNKPLRPFPRNPAFQSQPVLSEELREMIYLKVVRDGLTVRTVSTLMGVSMERVGAVVRMKQMEREWVREGKPLAVPYSKAVLDMLPTTAYVDPTDRKNTRGGRPTAQTPHESINDLPVHPYTTQQTFVSVPESRHFTRKDAAAAFNPDLKPADDRIPHSELVEIEKFKLANTDTNEIERFTARIIQQEKSRIASMAELEKSREEKFTTVWSGKKWDFKVKNISVDPVGKDGRNRAGVGWRYGMPHEDRKRGQVKIPTSVP